MDSHGSRGPHDGDHGSIELGTVGFPSDTGTSYVDQGLASNDGYTLVNVTLFRGRDPSTPLDQSKAQGKQILCRIGGGVNRIPALGTQVVVAVPATYGDIPGAAVIISTIEKSPTIQFSPTRTVLDFGNNDVVIRGKSVTLQSNPNSGAPQFVSVGQPPSGGAPGILMMDETGSGVVVQTGVVGIAATDNGAPPHMTSIIQLKDGEVSVVVGQGKAGAKWTASDQKIVMFGAGFYTYTAGTYLGASAVALNVALYGVPASPTPSASVFIGV